MKIRSKQAMQKLQQTWDENPLAVIVAAAGLLAGTARLIEALSGIRSRGAYARKMNRK